MNPITTAAITSAPSPSLLLIEREPGGAITYVAIGMDPPAAIDMLRRALIHVVAQHHSLATVPTHAAIVPNGHTPSDPSNPSDPSPIPPLRVRKDLPKTSSATVRGKPGPKPGARRRKVDVEAEMEF
jgi:hypothetical protein